MADVLYDGLSADTLARRCGVPRAVVLPRVNSTMDAAHGLAEAGAPAGTLVLTDRQTMGRGRSGRTWDSAPGESITLTLIERPLDAVALAVLSLRLGLAAAPVLDRYAPSTVRLKWPNDLVLDDGKLAGILVEVRWRGQRPEWVAIGFGLNVRRPPLEGTAGLAPGSARVEILAALIPVLRAAASTSGELTAREVEGFGSRDWARGRSVVQPAAGVVRGVSAAGALLVETRDGLQSCSTGSLVLAET